MAQCSWSEECVHTRSEWGRGTNRREHGWKREVGLRQKSGEGNENEKEWAKGKEVVG